MNWVAEILFKLYRYLLSPVLHWIVGPGSGCRHDPSCSEYARDVIVKRGWTRGGAMALRRLLRCQPFSG